MPRGTMASIIFWLTSSSCHSKFLPWYATGSWIFKMYFQIYLICFFPCDAFAEIPSTPLGATRGVQFHVETVVSRMFGIALPAQSGKPSPEDTSSSWWKHQGENAKGGWWRTRALNANPFFLFQPTSHRHENTDSCPPTTLFTAEEHNW